MIVDSKNIPQFIDELNIEVDQIKKELQQTVKNVEYASEYSEGVKLGDLLVGSQSTQVIAPQITMTAGPESGQFFLELPVGTESGQIVRPEVQNDANAESLEPEALLTGQTVESYLNSNTNFITLNSTYNVFYRKHCGICELIIANQGTSIPEDTLLGILPIGYRPAYGRRISNYYGNGYLIVNSDGNVYWGGQEVTYAMATLVYFI